jgi:hypothetical protein
MRGSVLRVSRSLVRSSYGRFQPFCRWGETGNLVNDLVYIVNSDVGLTFAARNAISVECFRYVLKLTFLGVD